jgi:Pvc16 N-terminal domain
MIFQAMELIRRNLNTFLSNNTVVVPEPVVLKNIAFATPDSSGTPNVDESAQVYMSLVNVEEEMTLKNLSAVRQNEIRPLAYVNPPLYLNLYLLFSANHKDYNMAITSLGQILLFFQGNRVFSLSITPVAATGPFATTGENENKIKITLDLMSLTFEQVNYLWGSLGGKQMPFLLFKARLVEIDADRMLKGGGFISEIQIN